MPTLGASLDFAKYEGRNFRGHQLGTAPASPVTGQLYYNTADNTLYWYDGSAWVSARGGAAATPPASTTALGTIQLAGDLTGTATSPQIAAGVITDADVNAANKDGAAGVASMRTLGTGAGQAAAGNDARFTDARTPTAHRLTHEPGGSDPMTVDAAVATGSLRSLGAGAQQAMPGNRTLDAISAPVANVNLNNKIISNLLDPVANTDAANKQYVDNTTQGLDAKASVRVASTGANLTLSGLQTVDGISLIAGDRVLVKDQSTTSANGVYVVASGAWTRATDTDTWNELVSAYVFVEEGTVNADSGWTCTVNRGGTIDTTAVTWVQFSGAGQVIAGAGLTKTGNSIDAVAGPGITVNPDSIQVANNGITNAMIADGAIDLNSADVTNVLPVGSGGTGSSFTSGARNNLSAAGWYTTASHAAGTTITVTQATHGLRQTRGLIVMTVIDATGAEVLADVVVSGVGDVTVTFGASQAANSIRVTIVG